MNEFSFIQIYGGSHTSISVTRTTWWKEKNCCAHNLIYQKLSQRTCKIPTPHMLVVMLGEVILRGMHKHYDGENRVAKP